MKQPPDYQLHHGDCLDVLPTIESESVDAIITDPPYPYIKREYGFWTEAEWLPMMQEVVRQSRRILKPTGSMVIILQPNSEKVGSMRLWLWRFMLWAGEYWNIVQDAYWWNYTALPLGAIGRNQGMMRPSIKPCLWIGNANCYKNQSAVLWKESEISKAAAMHKRHRNGERDSISGHKMDSLNAHLTSTRRGGVTPFNLMPIPQTQFVDNAGAHGHGAGTPLKLCDWWTRYICPPGGVVADWFAGTATTGIAALQNGCGYVGVERFDKYIPVAEQRLKEAKEKQVLPLFNI